MIGRAPQSVWLALLLAAGCTLSSPAYTRRVASAGGIGDFYIELRSTPTANPRVLMLALTRELVWHCGVMQYSHADIRARRVWRPHNRPELWAGGVVRCHGVEP